MKSSLWSVAFIFLHNHLADNWQSQTAENVVLQHLAQDIYVFSEYNLPNGSWENDEFSVMVHCPAGDPVVNIAQAS
ncbi:unnamed protein product [Diabrotica balteata]|uniref:Uncharacterized protein n=1 Tax=Diabrotica balteata TaxID=107213 RepID=A0A9N9T0K1_DIABA|nr:unnamed protein product [Diabrotica balteata]